MPHYLIMLCANDALSREMRIQVLLRKNHQMLPSVRLKTGEGWHAAGQ